MRIRQYSFFFFINIFCSIHRCKSSFFISLNDLKTILPCMINISGRNRSLYVIVSSTMPAINPAATNTDLKSRYLQQTVRGYLLFMSPKLFSWNCYQCNLLPFAISYLNDLQPLPKASLSKNLFAIFILRPDTYVYGRDVYFLIIFMSCIPLSLVIITRVLLLSIGFEPNCGNLSSKTYRSPRSLREIFLPLLQSHIIKVCIYLQHALIISHKKRN